MSSAVTAPDADGARVWRLKAWSSGPRTKVVACAVSVLLVWLLAPLVVNNTWLSVLCYAGISGIAALGLNLLTGYAGQISLGQSTLVGTGAYTAVYFGQKLDLPLVIWLPLAGLFGAAVAALIGPLALRMRDLYLVMVTLGLVYVGLYVFSSWTSLTGGNAGQAVALPTSIGGLNFNAVRLFGRTLSRSQGYFWLIWGVLIIGAVVLSNIVGSRTGRALAAVRQREVAAMALSIEPSRYKLLALIISGFYAGVAGGLYADYQQYVTPTEFGIGLAVQYVAIIIVGGLASVGGTILGAIFLAAVPQLLSDLAGRFPGLASDNGGSGVLSLSSLNQIVFGALIIIVLFIEPRGLAAAVSKFRSRTTRLAGRLTHASPTQGR